MAGSNPRKFSEKIALHTQKQAQETAAFEQIMREVMGATRAQEKPGVSAAQSASPAVSHQDRRSKGGVTGDNTSTPMDVGGGGNGGGGGDAHHRPLRVGLTAATATGGGSGVAAGAVAPVGRHSLGIPETRGLGAFRAGSLPNVTQLVVAPSPPTSSPATAAATAGASGGQAEPANAGAGGGGTVAGGRVHRVGGTGAAPAAAMAAGAPAANRSNSNLVSCSAAGSRSSQIDLAGALSHLESMKRGDVSPARARSHHRQRAATAGSHQRYDVSPYSSSNFLSLPHESGWRRTNSDSAINQSPSRGEPFSHGCSPSHRRSTVNTCSQSEAIRQLGIYEMLQLDHQHQPGLGEQRQQQQQLITVSTSAIASGGDSSDGDSSCRPQSVEIDGGGGRGVCGQPPSPSHLSPPPATGGAGLLGHSGSLPDLTSLQFGNVPAPTAGLHSLHHHNHDYHHYQQQQSGLETGHHHHHQQQHPIDRVTSHQQQQRQAGDLCGDCVTISSHVSGVASLDGSPESVYSCTDHSCNNGTTGGLSAGDSCDLFHDFQDCSTSSSPLHPHHLQQHQPSRIVVNGCSMAEASTRLASASPQVSPPRITVEGLTLDTIALSLDSGGIAAVAAAATAAAGMFDVADGNAARSAETAVVAPASATGQAAQVSFVTQRSPCSTLVEGSSSSSPGAELQSTTSDTSFLRSRAIESPTSSDTITTSATTITGSNAAVLDRQRLVQGQSPPSSQHQHHHQSVQLQHHHHLEHHNSPHHQVQQQQQQRQQIQQQLVVNGTGSTGLNRSNGSDGSRSLNAGSQADDILRHHQQSSPHSPHEAPHSPLSSSSLVNGVLHNPLRQLQQAQHHTQQPNRLSMSPALISRLSNQSCIAADGVDLLSDVAGCNDGFSENQNTQLQANRRHSPSLDSGPSHLSTGEPNETVGDSNNVLYDPYFYNQNDLVDFDKIGRIQQHTHDQHPSAVSGAATGGLTGYYSDNSLQSPGSAGIPDIILTEPYASFDEASNHSAKVLSSSVGSGGQYFTPSASPAGSPLQSRSPQHNQHSNDLHETLRGASILSSTCDTGSSFVSAGLEESVMPIMMMIDGSDLSCEQSGPTPGAGINCVEQSSPGSTGQTGLTDPIVGFESADLFQADQIDLDGLQLLPEQEAALLAAVGGAQGFGSQ